MDSLSLDQFLVLVTAVDEGSFAGAARKLNRAQSAVTYAVQKLEEQVGADLFDRRAYRAVLSDAGRQLLPTARRILEDVDLFRSQARQLHRGLETELRLVVVDMMPIDIVARWLREFSQRFPSVRTHISIESLDAASTLRKGEADIGIVVHHLVWGEDFETWQIRDFDLVAVASSAHPLARRNGTLTSEVLRDHLQIVLSGKSPAGGERDHGVVSLDSLRVTDLRAKRDLLLSGIGWGSMPDQLVADDIAAGHLVKLPLDRWDGADRLPRLSLVAACRRPVSLGPAGRWTVAEFKRLGAVEDPA